MNFYFLGKTLIALLLIICSTFFLNRKYAFKNLLVSTALVVISFIAGNYISDLLTKAIPDRFYESLPHLHGIVALLFSFDLTIVLFVCVKLIGSNKFISWFKNEGTPSPIEYGRDEATALKGIAILLMLFHHLFLKDRLELYSISFVPFPTEFMTKLAAYFKICVSIYAFVSGYGLFLSYQKKKTSNLKWIAQRYLKTFSGFWTIVVLSWIVCQLIDGRVSLIYFDKSPWAGIAYMVLEWFGLSNLFGTPSLCFTWWYMSAAFVFIVLTPIVARDKNSIAISCLVVMIAVRVIFAGDLSGYYNDYMKFTTPLPFIMPFLIGALFAKNDLIIKIVNARHRYLRLIIEVSLIILFALLYLNLSSLTFYDIKMGIFALPVILFCIEYVIPRKGVHSILVFLGKHSMNIFLIHSFIRGMYLQDFTYSFPHFTIMFIVLLILSLLISLAVEGIEKLLRYNEFINSCLR